MRSTPSRWKTRTSSLQWALPSRPKRIIPFSLTSFSRRPLTPCRWSLRCSAWSLCSQVRTITTHLPPVTAATAWPKRASPPTGERRSLALMPAPPRQSLLSSAKTASFSGPSIPPTTAHPSKRPSAGLPIWISSSLPVLPSPAAAPPAMVKR